MEKCLICKTPTDKCCSLCRKAFYCTPQHQQIDWHMSHKKVCSGKYGTQYQQIEQDSRLTHQKNTDLIDKNSKKLSGNAKIQHEAKIFIDLFEERLILRKKVVSAYVGLREEGNINSKELLMKAIELCDLSSKVTEVYNPSLANLLSYTYGLVTNPFILSLDTILDHTLLARLYHESHYQKQLKQILLKVSHEIEEYPQYMDEEFVESYRNILMGIIDISQKSHFDRVSERMYGFYIKLVEKFQGVWEQIYAYYLMGLWYSSKTYYLKSLKCLNYSQQLLISHKTKEPANTSTIFKSTLNFNISLCHHALSDTTKAIDCMYEAYKLRIQAYGKNAIQTSECLFYLSSWEFENESYEKCLMYAGQCRRIRKLNEQNQPTKYEEINKLIIEVYSAINKLKQQSQNQIQPKTHKYFDSLLPPNYTPNQPEPQSFTKRLLEPATDYTNFKLTIPPQLADTFTSEQWSKLGGLIDRYDEKMNKEEAIHLILESQFSQALDENQRDAFIKLNKIY